jgi:hypothetical protein
MLAGYGPLLGFAVTFLLVVTLVPTIARQETVVGQNASTAPIATATTKPGAALKTPGANAPRGSKRPERSKQRVLGVAPSAAAAPPATAVTGSVPVPTGAAVGTGACADRRMQVVGDPYSPPCIAWPAGMDNGGATSRGVTRDAIRVSVRFPIEQINDLGAVIRQLAGDKGDKVPSFSEDDLKRTAEDHATYFSRKFQFYGRKLDFVEWQGKGSILNDLQGAGQEAATADAIKAAKELKVFADLTAITQPYADALARQQVVNLGAAYLSRQWFAAHAPYSWSMFPDCTSLADTVAEYLNKRVFRYPADHAGPGLAGKPRKVAIIAADDPEHQQCVHDAEKIINGAGNSAHLYSYTFDLATFPVQAASLAAKLKQDGATTVVLITDPLMPLLISSQMSQQNYYPEWVETGVLLGDQDEIAQLYGAEQWKHAFGISQGGEEQPYGASEATAAAKSVDPNYKPSFADEIIYNFCYQLAIGIQGAGPDLTPQTFAAGMRAYPGGTGPAGTWRYPDGEFTPYRDAREIWWDPNAKSVVNGSPGRYASTNQRYRPGQWPTGPAAPQQLQMPGYLSTPPEKR